MWSPRGEWWYTGNTDNIGSTKNRGHKRTGLGRGRQKVGLNTPDAAVWLTEAINRLRADGLVERWEAASDAYQRVLAGDNVAKLGPFHPSWEMPGEDLIYVYSQQGKSERERLLASSGEAAWFSVYGKPPLVEDQWTRMPPIDRSRLKAVKDEAVRRRLDKAMEQLWASDLFVELKKTLEDEYQRCGVLKQDRVPPAWEEDYLFAILTATRFDQKGVRRYTYDPVLTEAKTAWFLVYGDSLCTPDVLGAFPYGAKRAVGSPEWWTSVQITALSSTEPGAKAVLRLNEIIKQVQGTEKFTAREQERLDLAARVAKAKNHDGSFSSDCDGKSTLSEFIREAETPHDLALAEEAEIAWFQVHGEKIASPGRCRQGLRGQPVDADIPASERLENKIKRIRATRLFASMQKEATEDANRFLVPQDENGKALWDSDDQTLITQFLLRAKTPKDQKLGEKTAAGWFLVKGEKVSWRERRKL